MFVITMGCSRHLAHAMAPVSFYHLAAYGAGMQVRIVFLFVYAQAGGKEIDRMIYMNHSITQNKTIDTSANLERQATKE